MTTHGPCRWWPDFLWNIYKKDRRGVLPPTLPFPMFIPNNVQGRVIQLDNPVGDSAVSTVDAVT